MMQQFQQELPSRLAFLFLPSQPDHVQLKNCSHSSSGGAKCDAHFHAVGLTNMMHFFCLGDADDLCTDEFIVQVICSNLCKFVKIGKS